MSCDGLITPGVSYSVELQCLAVTGNEMMAIVVPGRGEAVDRVPSACRKPPLHMQAAHNIQSEHAVKQSEERGAHIRDEAIDECAFAHICSAHHINVTTQTICSAEL